MQYALFFKQRCKGAFKTHTILTAIVLFSQMNVFIKLMTDNLVYVCWQLHTYNYRYDTFLLDIVNADSSIKTNFVGS